MIKIITFAKGETGRRFIGMCFGSVRLFFFLCVLVTLWYCILDFGSVELAQLNIEDSEYQRSLSCETKWTTQHILNTAQAPASRQSRSKPLLSENSQTNK